MKINNIIRFHIFIWILGLACIMQAQNCYALSPEAEHPVGVAARCFDGDTIKLSDRRVVRLAGIDAPELAHGGNKAQFYSRQSREALESLVKGKKVKLVFPGTAYKDRHGRLIADIHTEDGESVNEKMVEQGAAFFYPHQDLGPEFQERLRELQADAIHERRGLWDKLLSMPIAKKNYVGNRASLRFFPESSQQAKNIKPRNRVNFGTLMDAFLAGYAPSRVTPFWPEDKGNQNIPFN